MYGRDREWNEENVGNESDKTDYTLKILTYVKIHMLMQYLLHCKFEVMYAYFCLICVAFLVHLVVYIVFGEYC